MELQKLDIVNLIDNNPLIKLSDNYQNNFLEKLKEKFTDSQQRLFVSSFYCYLNYNSKADFVIDMSDIWKWLGFGRKEECKRVLTKHFTINTDYKINIINKVYEEAAPPTCGAGPSTKNLGGAGLNKEKILMNINTFKKLCLKSNTKKADEIHDYFIKLEETLQETINEESMELRNQLLYKEQLLIEQKEQTELEKEILLETTLLQQFPINTQCIYIAKIDNKDAKNGNLVSFGMSNNLQERIKVHKKTYINFRLTNVFKVNNHIEIENCIKKHKILKQRIRYLMINDINYREHLCIDADKKDNDFTIDKLYNYIKEIIEENQYNIENYKKLIEKNNNLECEITNLRKHNEDLINKNNKLQSELDKFNPTIEEKYIKSHCKQETVNGYSLFVYEINDLRYKIGLSKNVSLESKEKMYKASYPNGNMKLKILLKHSFMEKIMMYLLKRHLIFLNNDTYDGSFDNIKLILNLISKIEDLLINNDIENIINIMNNDKIEIENNDPEIPYIRKSKRSIDQIDKDTGKLIATYPSIEAAGRALGLTTGTAIGIALRNKSLSQGYMWRYSGISKDDQMKDQPVIRINCKTGEKTSYPNIASAAKTAKISAPGLRNRILTDVHVKGYHWVFDKESSHYK